MPSKLPPKIVETKDGGGPARRTAWGCVLSNLVLPGLGTFAARRRVQGTLQIVVSQTGFVLMVVWTGSFVRQWLRQGSFPEDLGPRSGLCLLGLALFLLAWIWSLASSYGILKDSRTGGL